MNKTNLPFLKLIVEKKIILYFFLGIIVYLAYYFHLRKFGLYEDDYWFVGIPANSTFKEMLEFFKSNLINFERNQGRYLAAVLPLLLPFINFKIGGLFFLYFFGIILVTINSILVYNILSKKLPEYLAFIGALTFILFPADTTKALLVHIYQLQLSLLFTLAGMLLYVNNRKVIAYVIAFLSLITYENAFLAFIFIPLIDTLEWKKKMWRQLIFHWIIIGIVFIFLFFLRKSFGEKIVTELELFEMIKKTFLALIIGPVTAIWSFIQAPVITLINYKTALIFILISGIIFLSYQYLKYHKIEFSEKWIELFKINSRILKCNFILKKDFDYALKSFVIGACILIVAYIFSITHYPPSVLKGRGTSVHLGATFGAALIIASIIYFLYYVIKSGTWRKVFIIAVSIYFAFLVGYGSLIQKDYIKSWEIQKKFWKEVTAICPDLEDGTLIFVRYDGNDPTDFIVTHSWACPMVLENLYKFPGSWNRFPKLQLIDNELYNLFEKEDSSLIFRPNYPFLFNNQEKIKLEDGNVIILEYEEDKLKRISDNLVIHDLVLRLKKTEEEKTIHIFEKSNIYPYIIED